MSLYSVKVLSGKAVVKSKNSQSFVASFCAGNWLFVPKEISNPDSLQYKLDEIASAA